MSTTRLSNGQAIAGHFLASLDKSERGTTPYRHWLLQDMLPADTMAAIDALPYAPPSITETMGKRETNNSTRAFFGTAARESFPVCEELAEAFQANETVQALSAECGTDLSGMSLRIEYCLDTDGFWLQSHTDIGAKRFTMLIYLSEGEGSETWGTDIMTEDGQVLATSPYARGAGLIFVPGHDTWHGFHKRPIKGVRRSLIVNYVGPEWRARQELAFPETPVLAA